MANKKHDVYMPLMIGDWYKGTRGMKAEVRGVYLSLLMYQWDNGFIPSDIEELALIEPEVGKVWVSLKCKFQQAAPGKLQNVKMEEVRAFFSKQSDNGKKGGRPRKPKRNPNVNPNTNLHNDIDIEHESDNDIENEDFGKFENLFFGDVPHDLVNLSAMLTPTEKADEWHDYVEKKINDLGYETEREVHCKISDDRNGRIDLVAKKNGIVVGIELDYRTPRFKSVAKVKNFPCGMVLLRDPKIIRKSPLLKIVSDEPEVLVYPTFQDFWTLYGKDVGKENCQLIWIDLFQGEKEIIMAHVAEYVQANEQFYRQNPERYLINKTWKDEIITKPNGQSGNSNNKLSPQYLKDLERRINS